MKSLEDKQFFAYLCSVKGEANRRQTESNQARLNCRGAKEEGEAK